MIYLITGLPGNGKTLYALNFVKAKAEKENRPVFYARIKGLKLPWQAIDAFDWPNCPPNSIVVIDECQQANDPQDPKSPSLFGVRPRGSKVPPWAAALETHRHSGIDLVLITQSPTLLDSHDRALVGLHFHVVRNFGMARATVHEFQQCKVDVLKSRNGSIRHEWRYPKVSYGWYESAEVHTHKARVPMRVWLLCSIPVVIGACGYLYWSRLDARMHPGGSGGAVGATAGAGAVPGAKSVRTDAPLTPAQYAEQFAPRVAGLAYTAPAYDEVTKPARAPYPAACVQSQDECRCYSQQATRLDVPLALCHSIVHGGFFMAWDSREPPEVRAAAIERLEDREPARGTLVSLGGDPRAHVREQR